MEEEGDWMSHLYDACSQYDEVVSKTYIRTEGMELDI